MPDILQRIGVKATADKVCAAIATPEGGAGWWTIDTTGSGEVGGVLHFQFGKTGFFDMKVLQREPGRTVVWEVLDGPAEWIGTKVRWELHREDDYTIVVFKHEGWKAPTESMHHCTTKWAVFLVSLKAFVETGQGKPFPDDVMIDNWR